MPKLVPTVKVPDWIWNPAKKIRGVIFTLLIGGIISTFKPILEGILTILRGSNPGPSASDPFWGIADLIVAWPSIGMDLMERLMVLYFDLLLAIPQMLMGPDPGPFLGAAAAILFVVEVLVSMELFRRAILAAAAAVNLDAVADFILGRGGGG